MVHVAMCTLSILLSIAVESSTKYSSSTVPRDQEEHVDLRIYAKEDALCAYVLTGLRRDTQRGTPYAHQGPPHPL